MAVKIKLKRLGRTRVPTYRIVVADARTKRDGRAIEEIGKYHPKEEPSFIEVNSERAQHWLSVGAQPTEPVMTILKITGDWQKFKGEPGQEGTLRTKEAPANKQDRFAEALKDAAKDDTPSTTSRGGARPKKAATAKADSTKADTAKADTAQGRDTKADTAKADTAKADRAKADTGKAKSKGGAAETAAEATDEGATATAGTAPAAAGEPESSEPGSGA